MLWCTGRFKLISERGQRWRGMDLIWKIIPNSGSIKSKTIYEQKGRTLEIATTLAVPGAIGTVVRRKIWSKISRIKISV